MNVAHNVNPESIDALGIHRKEKTAQLVWTAFILMFFFVQAIVWITALTLTSNDTSHAVVAGYDEQALRWDEVKSLRAASDALGWKADVLVDSDSDIHMNRVVTLTVLDQDEQPVNDALVELRAFHVGRAAEPQTLKLQQINPGVYSGSLNVRRSGSWQFEGAVVMNSSKRIIDQRIFIADSKGK